MAYREDPLQFDQRIIAFRMRKGELSSKDIAHHLSSLPDSASNAEYINVAAEISEHALGEGSASNLTFVAADND